jgi:hypothetical protein
VVESRFCILDVFACKRLLFVFLPVPQAIDSRAFHFAAGFISLVWR